MDTKLILEGSSVGYSAPHPCQRTLPTSPGIFAHEEGSQPSPEAASSKQRRSSFASQVVGLFRRLCRYFYIGFAQSNERSNFELLLGCTHMLRRPLLSSLRAWTSSPLWGCAGASRVPAACSVEKRENGSHIKNVNADSWNTLNSNKVVLYNNNRFVLY